MERIKPIKQPFVFCGFGWGGRPVGTFRYAKQLLFYLDQIISEQKLDLDIRVLIPTSSQLDASFQNIKIVRYGWFNESNRLLQILTKRLWKYFQFPRYLRKVHGIGIDLSLNFPKGNVSMTALHDCISESFYLKQGTSGCFHFSRDNLSRKIYCYRVAQLVRESDRQIITVSEFSRQELMRCYRLPKDRIEVIGNGWEHMEKIEADDSILEKLGLNSGREYIFSLGSREPHKNTAWVLQAAKKNPQYDFVLTGQNRAGEQINGILPNVIYTDFLKDSQMKALMQHCKAFLQPSFVEGFGIPPLEALSLGKRIIVSNTSSLPEIFGDSAWYVDPYRDAVDLDELMKTPVSDGKKVLETYTWRHAAEKMLRLLQVQ